MSYPKRYFDLNQKFFMYLEIQIISYIHFSSYNKSEYLNQTHTYSKDSFQRKEPFVHIILQEGFLD
jgi:hypothetical protein